MSNSAEGLPRVARISQDRASGGEDTITLDETARHRRRAVMTSDAGLKFLLDFPRARLLRDGEILVLDDGRQVVVRAAAEALYRVTAKGAHHLLQLAWQLGNRHLPVQVTDDALYIREDAVIRAMLEGLGAQVEELAAPFHPEGGAYDHSGHDHHNG